MFLPIWKHCCKVGTFNFRSWKIGSKHILVGVSRQKKRFYNAKSLDGTWRLYHRLTLAIEAKLLMIISYSDNDYANIKSEVFNFDCLVQNGDYSRLRIYLRFAQHICIPKNTLTTLVLKKRICPSVGVWLQRKTSHNIRPVYPLKIRIICE